MMLPPWLRAHAGQRCGAPLLQIILSGGTDSGATVSAMAETAVPSEPTTTRIPAEPGQLERYDYEYRRNGTVNLFVCIDVHRPWRKAKVTERRAAEDYAQCMRELSDVHYPDAEYIRVVQDNLSTLSTHSAGALYEAFAPAEARRILRRLEFHYTPKHASWLNMVEIEIGVLRGQCLDRRIDDPKRLINEIAAWEHETPPAPASNGCSQPIRPAPKWAAPIR
jgi:DDE superfamily endonuclease